jgi:hypothetical protein
MKNAVFWDIRTQFLHAEDGDAKFFRDVGSYQRHGVTSPKAPFFLEGIVRRFCLATNVFILIPYAALCTSK